MSTEAASGFDAPAVLDQALRQRQWALPSAWRDEVIENLQRIHGMISELDALPVDAGGLTSSPTSDDRS